MDFSDRFDNTSISGIMDIFRHPTPIMHKIAFCLPKFVFCFFILVTSIYTLRTHIGMYCHNSNFHIVASLSEALAKFPSFIRRFERTIDNQIVLIFYCLLRKFVRPLPRVLLHTSGRRPTIGCLKAAVCWMIITQIVYINKDICVIIILEFFCSCCRYAAFPRTWLTRDDYCSRRFRWLTTFSKLFGNDIFFKYFLMLFKRDVYVILTSVGVHLFHL